MDRRSFIKYAGLGALGLALTQVASAKVPAPVIPPYVRPYEDHEGQITDVIYNTGKDGLVGNADDFIDLRISGDASTFRINSDKILGTGLKDRLQRGKVIRFEANRRTTPEEVTEIYNLWTSEEYYKKQAEDKKWWDENVFNPGQALKIGGGTVVLGLAAYGLHALIKRRMENERNKRQ